MRKTPGIFATAIAFAALAMACACDAAGVAATKPANARPETKPAATDSAPQKVDAQHSIATDDYRLVWSDAGAVCNDALIALNQSRARENSPGDKGRDYAANQAQQFIHTARNIEWKMTERATPGSEWSEVAAFDYFNDGITRQIVRMHGRLAGHSIIMLGVEKRDDASPAVLHFGHAGALLDNLPDRKNLHTKLTYSVNDVVKLDDGYFTLIMPLEDVDGSGRVYLVSWRAKKTAQNPPRLSDYYPQISCVFQLTDRFDRVH